MQLSIENFPVKTSASNTTQETFDAIVILGAAVWADGEASPTLKRRTLHAVEKFHAGAAPLIVCSGGVGKHPPSEAEVMANLCRAHGVPEDALILEDQSTSTIQNVILSTALLKARDAASVLVVSDPYHLPRATMCFRHFGMACKGTSSAQPSTLSPARKLYMRLRECLALPVYYVRLKLGAAA